MTQETYFGSLIERFRFVVTWAFGGTAQHGENMAEEAWSYGSQDEAKKEERAPVPSRVHPK